MYIANPITFAIPVIAMMTTAPALADENANLDFSVPLMPFNDANRSNQAKISVGSIGLDSRAGASYLADRRSDPYVFQVPSQAPARKYPGILFRIPLGNSSP